MIVVLIIIGAVLLFLVVMLLCTVRCGAWDDELMERKLKDHE